MLSLGSGTDTDGGGKIPLAIVHGKEDTAVLLSSGKSLYLLARAGVQESMATGLVLGSSREGSASLHWDGTSYTIFDLHDKGSFQQVRRTKVMCKP